MQFSKPRQTCFCIEYWPTCSCYSPLPLTFLSLSLWRLFQGNHDTQEIRTIQVSPCSYTSPQPANTPTFTGAVWSLIAQPDCWLTADINRLLLRFPLFDGTTCRWWQRRERAHQLDDWTVSRKQQQHHNYDPSYAIPIAPLNNMLCYCSSQLTQLWLSMLIGLPCLCVCSWHTATVRWSSSFSKPR